MRTGETLSGAKWFVRALRSGPIEWAVMRRALTLWFLLRITVGGLAAATGEGSAGILTPYGSLAVVALAGFLSRLDTRRRNEVLLLANLGTSASMTNLLSFGPPMVIEFTIAVLTRL